MLAILFAASLVGETLTGPAIALGGPSLQMAGPDGATWHVLLYGINTPDMGAPLGAQARGFLDDLIKGREIQCRVLAMGSRQGTAWATCEADGRDLSEAVLREGLATAYRAFTYAGGADLGLAARLDAAEAAARGDGLGIWATTATATAADKSLWQAIVDDPRAVATLIGALAGFTLGVLIKFGFDLVLDDVRRRQARRALAAELHAELQWVLPVIQRIIAETEKTIETEAGGSAYIETTRYQWQAWEVPPMPVLDAHIGRLGLFPQILAKSIVAYGGTIAWTRHRCRAFAAGVDADHTTVEVADLRDIVRLHKSSTRLVVRSLNKNLARAAGVAPHNWAKIEAELVAEERAAQEQAKEAADSDA